MLTPEHQKFVELAVARAEARRVERETIRKKIRSGATPRHVSARIVRVADIPRTKSGKITELAVRDVIHGRPVKNTEALDLYRDLPELRA